MRVPDDGTPASRYAVRMLPKRRAGWIGVAVACLLPFSVACGGNKAPAPAEKTPAARATAAPATHSATATAAAATTTGTPARPPANATVTASGLRYIDQAIGTGASPRIDQRVTVHYTGRIESNNQVFDSSRDRGQPATFAMNQVIKGFSEALTTMRVGGQRTVYIPAALGYGAVPNGPIPPNSDLIFDIELISAQ